MTEYERLSVDYLKHIANGIKLTLAAHDFLMLRMSPTPEVDLLKLAAEQQAVNAEWREADRLLKDRVPDTGRNGGLGHSPRLPPEW